MGASTDEFGMKLDYEEDEETYFANLASELIDISNKLNISSDILNKQIDKFEAELRTVKLNVTCWLPIYSDKYIHDASKVFSVDIGFASNKQASMRWSLMCRLMIDNEVVKLCPLSQAPRVYRLFAVDRLEDLMILLLKTSNDLLATLKLKTANLRQMLYKLTITI